MNEHSGNRFRLEINSLEEFVIFCAVIRGENLDEAKLQELAAKLSQSTKAQSDAIRADAGTHTS